MKAKSEWVDFKEVKSRVSIEEILKHYGLVGKLKREKDELVGACPIHGGDNKKAFRANMKMNAWYCFSRCRRGGNVIDFVAAVEKVSLRDAALKIQDWFGSNNQSKKKPGREREEAVNSPLTFELKTVDPKHPYLGQRRLKEETIKEFGLGFCKRGLMKERIAIPVHNEKGQLVAYAGRYPGDPPEGEPEYKFPPKFEKNLVVYNLNRVDKETRELIVVEGFFDVFRLWQAGFKNVVALMGSSLSKKQKELIISTADKVVLMFDGDEASGKAAADIVPRLLNEIYVKVIGLPEGVSQPDELSEKQTQKVLKDKE